MQIYRTQFEDNKASLGGGAIIMSGSKGLVLVDAEFVGNSAGSSGGAFQVDNGKMSMVRGRIVGSLGRPQIIPPEKPTRLTSQEWGWNKCNDPEGEDKCKAGQGVCRGRERDGARQQHTSSCFRCDALSSLCLGYHPSAKQYCH